MKPSFCFDTLLLASTLTTTGTSYSIKMEGQGGVLEFSISHFMLALPLTSPVSGYSNLDFDLWKKRYMSKCSQ